MAETQPERNARLVLELVQARRQLTAIRGYRDSLMTTTDAYDPSIEALDPTTVAAALDAALNTQPATTPPAGTETP